MIAHFRWGDDDRYFGPFTYARDKRYRPLAMVLSSRDDEDVKCHFRISAWGHTLIVVLPEILKPWRQKIVAVGWDAATIARLGRNWYWSIHPRKYGFSCAEGHVSIFFGRQTGDSSTEQRRGWFLPWTQWRHVRFSLYGAEGEHFWTQRDEKAPALGKSLRGFDARREQEALCPSETFAFADFDGEELTARTQVHEREWRLGEGWFKWLSLFRKSKIRRSLDIVFSGETGKRKGSWKGGTIGHSIEMLPDELHEAAFRRYCAENEMKFQGVPAK